MPDALMLTMVVLSSADLVRIRFGSNQTFLSVVHITNKIGICPNIEDKFWIEFGSNQIWFESDVLKCGSHHQQNWDLSKHRRRILDRHLHLV